jgi:hypothetical protein
LGDANSRGRQPAYPTNPLQGQQAQIASTSLPSSRLRPAISAKALEPTLLPRPGMSPASASLASLSPAGPAAQGRRSEEATRRRPASAPPTGQVLATSRVRAKSSPRAWSRGKTLFLSPFVRGQDAISRHALPSVIRHATAAPTADGPSAKCSTANASGCLAAP